VRLGLRRYFEFANKTGTLIATAVVVVLVLFLIFPNLPIGGELLDMKSSYTYQEVMDSMEVYGADGRTIYLWASTVLDTVFPIVYATFFAGLIYRFRASESTWWLAYVPIVGGIWDLLENVQIASMLLAYPEIGETQVTWASTFTHLKHWIGSFYLIVGAVLLLVALVRKVFTKQ